MNGYGYLGIAEVTGARDFTHIGFAFHIGVSSEAALGGVSNAHVYGSPGYALLLVLGCEPPAGLRASTEDATTCAC